MISLIDRLSDEEPPKLLPPSGVTHRYVWQFTWNEETETWRETFHSRTLIDTPPERTRMASRP